MNLLKGKLNTEGRIASPISAIEISIQKCLDDGAIDGSNSSAESSRNVYTSEEWLLILEWDQKCHEHLEKKRLFSGRSIAAVLQKHGVIKGRKSDAIKQALKHLRRAWDALSKELGYVPYRQIDRKQEVLF